MPPHQQPVLVSFVTVPKQASIMPGVVDTVVVCEIVVDVVFTVVVTGLEQWRPKWPLPTAIKGLGQECTQPPLSK